MAMFSMRIVDADFYMTKPQDLLDHTYSDFSRSMTPNVPVIRIFGATPAGQRTCLHIHKIYPYFYVQMEQSEINYDNLHSFSKELDFALHSALGKAASSPTNYVMRIEAVKKVPYYGYHEGKKDFLKVYYYSPYLTSRIAEILLSGSVMNRVFQPYETHIPYILQFLIDFNLYGMNMINLSCVKFRRSKVIEESASSPPHYGSSVNPGSDELSPSSVELSSTCFTKWDKDSMFRCEVLPDDIRCQSTCELEVDCSGDNILNRTAIRASIGSNPGLDAIWEDEKQRRRLKNESSQITLQTSQDRPGLVVLENERLHLDSISTALEKRLQDGELVSPSLSTPSTPELLKDNSTRLLNRSSASSTEDSQVHDSAIVDILVDFLDGGEDELSDSDSVNYNPDHPVEEDKVQETEDDEESMLMSQRVFDDVDANERANEPTENSNSDYDEVQWGSSFAFDIPQLDGTTDLEPCNFIEYPPRWHFCSNIGAPRDKEWLTRARNIRKNRKRKTDSSFQVFKAFSRGNTMRGKWLLRIPQVDGSADESKESKELSPSLRKRSSHRGKRKTTRKSSLNFMLQGEHCLKNKLTDSQPESANRPGNIRDECEEGRVDTQPSASQKTSHTSLVPYSSCQYEMANTKPAKMSKLSLEIETADSMPVGGASFENQVGIRLAQNPSTNNSCYDSLYHMGRLSPAKMNLKLVSLPSPTSPTMSCTISEDTGETGDVAVSFDQSIQRDLCLPSSKRIGNSEERIRPNSNAIYDNLGSHCKGPDLTRNDMFDVSTFRHEETHFPRLYNFAGKAAFVYAKRPPLRQQVISDAFGLGLGEASHDTAFYGDKNDVPEKSMRIGPKVLKVHSRAVRELKEFASNSVVCGKFRDLADRVIPSFIRENESVAERSEALMPKRKLDIFGNSTVSLTPVKDPPSLSTVKNWLRVTGVPQNKKTSLYDKAEGLRDRNSVKEAEIKEKRKSLKPFEVTQNKPCSEGLKHDATPVLRRRFSAPHAGNKRPKSLSMKDNIQRLTEKDATLHTQKPNAGSPSYLLSPPLFFSPDKDFHGFKPPQMTSPFASTPIRERSPTGMLSPIRITQFSFIENEVKGITPHSKENFKEPLIRRRLSNTAYDLRRQIYQGVACGEVKRSISDTSQIEGPSPNNTFNFKVTQLNFQDAKALHVVQHLTKMSLEVHVHTRRNLLPDPDFDPIIACFYCILNDGDEGNMVAGVLIVDRESCKSSSTSQADNSGCSGNSTSPSKADLGSRGGTSSLFGTKGRSLLDRCGVTDCYQVQYFKDEESLLHGLSKLVREKDPDILMGYEIEMLSLGYLRDRASHLNIDLCSLLSRIYDERRMEKPKEDSDGLELKYLYGVDIKISGRIILNIWRIMRHEVNLNNYSFENVAFHVLHERFPLYSHRVLTDWWNHKTSLVRWRTVEYFIRRSQANVLLLERVDFINRTSELARLFGITFYSVISRGSQFRVESMMLRIAKPMGYIPVSPSVQQRAQMAAPECIPLVMEPESRFYVDPVLVLDFQSLYPSIIIAYNYCFSTCLGNVRHFNQSESFPFGALSHEISASTLKRLQGSLHVSPNGVAFVKPHVRRGVLPRMLEDILRTRVMVKNAMKKNKDDKILHRMLDARQLGLKLIANVTFGYTSANFSGRMPCIEIGDTIVRKARETLERAIELVNTNKEWHARVVYGDTDSMFVLLKRASKERAFAVAKEIVEAVTRTNPKPIKLKFEKVYYPCVLQTKKRYVGYMYETLDQKEPIFDAKGIETVRRDNCAAVAKVLEKSLRTLFETKNVSLVKKFAQRQFVKIMEGRVSLQDFTFAKEYRGMKNYKPGACVPALELARRRLVRDKRSEPRIGERVPYIIVYGTPGLPLIQLVRPPEELFKDASLRLNGMYYITKQIIPPFERVFTLMGVDVGLWFKDLPRISRGLGAASTSEDTKKGTISQYFTSMNCLICKELTRDPLCQSCSSNSQISAVTLASQLKKTERRFAQLTEICNNCAGFRDRDFFCVSLDCPVLYKLLRVQMERRKDSKIRDVLAKMM